MNEELHQRLERLESTISKIKMEFIADDALLKCLIEMMPENKLQKLLKKYDYSEIFFMGKDTEAEQQTLMDKVQFWREIMKDTILEISAQNSSDNTG